MRTPQQLGIVLAILLLLVLSTYPTQSWGQTPIHIGDVVTVTGVVEVRLQPDKEWRLLRLAAPILLHETVRTGSESIMQALLQRDDATWTLFERGEMLFTESSSPRCQRSLPQTMNLFQGIARFAFRPSNREAAVHTPNAVICIRGTTLIVIYDPQSNTTEVTIFEGSATVQNLDAAISGVESVPPNFHSRVVGANAPTVPERVSPAELKALQQNLRVTAQVPKALLPHERLPELSTPENPVYEVGINPHTDAISDPSVSPDVESTLEITFDIPR